MAQSCVLVTDVRGFANPVVARRLRASGARVAAVDQSIGDDGEEEGIALLAWDRPRALVERAAAHFGGRLDAIVIAPAMPAPRTPVDQLDVDQLMPFFQRLAAEALVFASAAAKVMRPQKSGRIVFGTSSGPIGGHSRFQRLCRRTCGGERRGADDGA